MSEEALVACAGVQNSGRSGGPRRLKGKQHQHGSSVNGSRYQGATASRSYLDWRTWPTA
ncbi:hypothetical protein ACFQO7_35275 [Catellatospora aurea]|uniref:Uncharacterized protein n=1 Tax=Catellatospora aurea TaxID=1337874 RepID=A0ABW2H653_9ACTN